MARASAEEAKARQAYQEAELRIAMANRKSSARLDLSGMGLASVPPEIGRLASLTVLYLGANQRTSVPPEIGQFARLTELFLADNQLTSVPPEIGQLARLTKLTLDGNELRTVPPEIGNLARLTRQDSAPTA